jgi:hypothetical protein
MASDESTAAATLADDMDAVHEACRHDGCEDAWQGVREHIAALRARAEAAERTVALAREYREAVKDALSKKQRSKHESAGAWVLRKDAFARLDETCAALDAALAAREVTK